jgi:ATP-dependent protease ClpP protease subunit
MQKISIFGPITEQLAEQVLAQIATLDRTEPLTVEINSDGGSVQAGVGLYAATIGWPGGLTTVVSGWALSIASLVFMAGSVRRIQPTSLFMVHAPWTGATGNANRLREQAEVLDRVAATMTAAYLRSGQPAAVVNKWLSGDDHWFTADETIAAGLATELVTAADVAPTPEFANAMACAIRIPSRLLPRIQAMNTTKPTNTDRESIAAAAVKAEGDRRASIAFSGQHAIAHAGMAELVKAMQNDPSVTETMANQRILAHLGAGAAPLAGGYRPDQSGDDRMRDFCAAATDVLLTRAGVKVAQPHPGARDIQRMSIVAMAEGLLSMRGSNPRDRTPSGVIQAAMTTDDFPGLLAATANKALATGYESAPIGHTLFTGVRDVPNFKPQTLVNLSEAPALEEVLEGAEYKSGAMQDSSTNFRVGTFGKILEISRQALVNDDLGALTSAPSAMGLAARRMEADKVFGMLTDGPNMRDGLPLFHAAHGNLGAAGALNIQNLAAGRAAMRKQKGIAGLGYLDPQPRFLIVPVALETLAEQLIASLFDPSKSNDTPNLEFIRGLTLVADPRLDAASGTAWYLAASPNQIDGILRVYLDGQQGPSIEEDVQFRRDVFGYKVRLDFGVGVIDHRALYKNPGA